MPRFIPTCYQQDIFIALNLENQLQSGTFEHALHYLIEHKLDLSIFHHNYKNKDTGRRAYNPAVLLKVILFAYSKGITSSREIEWCCANNIIFKALSCDSVPHFTTIADFISRSPEDIEAVFEQILLVCHQQGLLGNELFAIDGCKMPSDASKSRSGTFKELKEKRDKLKKLIKHTMKKHKEIDEEELDGSERKQRKEQTIQTLEQEHDKIVEFLDNNEPRKGHGKRKTEVKSNITDNESAKMTTSKGTIQGFVGVGTADNKHQIITDAQAFGSGQEHHLLQPVLQTIASRYQKLGISDNIYSTGIIVTADTGYANEGNMQYLHDNQINAYIPDNQFRSRDPKFADQKEKHGTRHERRPARKTSKEIPAEDFNFDPNKKSCICPSGHNMRLKKSATDKDGNEKQYFEGRLSDCRNCSIKKQCMRNPNSADKANGSGRQVSFITKKSPRKPNYTDWMKGRIDTDRGREIYGHRMSVIEPVFANIESNKGLKRFSLRGKAKVQGQWQLYCLVHNIEKLKNYGNLAIQ